MQIMAVVSRAKAVLLTVVCYCVIVMW